MGTYRSSYILVAGGLCVDANWNAKIATADFSVAQIIYSEGVFEYREYGN